MASQVEIVSFPLGSIVNFILEWIYFVLDMKISFPREIATTLYQSLLSSLIASLVAYTCLDFLSYYLDLHTFFGVFIQGFLSGVSGVFAGILILWSLRSREFFEIRLALSNRLRSTLLTIPNQEQL